MAGITQFYKGFSYGNRVSYNSNGTYMPSRSASVQREWCQNINFAQGTGLNTMVFEFPPFSIIDPTPYIYVRVAETTGTTKTINVGITGTAAGILSGISVAATGLILPTGGSTTTLGSLLNIAVATTPAVNIPTQYSIGATAVALTWTPGSANFATLDADIIIPYFVLDDDYIIPPMNVAMGPSP